MRLLILSDLHFEFHADHGNACVQTLPPSSEVDVCVLAGDIAVGPGIPKALDLFCTRYRHVVYTHGNHEFYGYTRASVLRWTREAEQIHTNLTWLDGAVKMVEGRRFIGGPLWFRDRPNNARIKRRMNDFRLIPKFDSWVYEENKRTLGMLGQELRKGDIVVTHHLPAPQSVSPAFRNSDLNAFFLCDVSALIEATQPALWIHGHTHDSCDYQLGKTRVVCNPFGYVRYQENAKFDFERIITV